MTYLVALSPEKSCGTKTEVVMVAPVADAQEIKKVVEHLMKARPDLL